MAFCRIDDRPIRVREPVTRPDALVVQDATLPHQVNVFEGLRPWGSPARAEPRVGGTRSWSTPPAVRTTWAWARSRGSSSPSPPPRSRCVMSAVRCPGPSCSAASRPSPAA
ncbi:hypothetical protein ACFY0P_08310 [Streptomyces sp. NPDC001714]|uniref:hypothetical protein n=1 Tax=Streptomyces sp. NPDC001714 TaxID=3364603 RepID=UPI00369C6614